MSSRRALHYVFKVGNRKNTIQFYKEVLGMKVLRHEEFEEGCKATCNGPYDGKWSKTMIGYGPEDDHFVAELTYNYGIKSYKLGNAFLGITVGSLDVDVMLEKAQTLNYSIKEEDCDLKSIEAPGGYKYVLTKECKNQRKDPVLKVTLACSNLEKSIGYWSGGLGMNVYEQADGRAVMGYSEEQCKLELKEISEPIDHAEAFGRIAISCPTNELAGIEETMKKAGSKILTPLVSLDTPGKATVHVVILADPDGHEICFVGDEAFRELSQVDPKAEELLTKALEADKSDEWFARKSQKKTAS